MGSCYSECPDHHQSAKFCGHGDTAQSAYLDLIRKMTDHQCTQIKLDLIDNCLTFNYYGVNDHTPVIFSRSGVDCGVWSAVIY